MFVVNKNPTVSDLHKFGLSMLIGFGVIGVVFWLVPWIKDRDLGAFAWSGAAIQVTALCLWAVGLGLFALSFGSPVIAKRVYLTWMSLTVPLGIVMSTILLTLLFVLLLPLFSIVVRIGDPLRRKLKTDATYWEDYKPYEPTLDRMKRPF